MQKYFVSVYKPMTMTSEVVSRCRVPNQFIKASPAISFYGPGMMATTFQPLVQWHFVHSELGLGDPSLGPYLLSHHLPWDSSPLNIPTVHP